MRRVFDVGPYTILRCHACGFGWPQPFPEAEELASFYSNCRHPEALDDSTNTSERKRIARQIRAVAPSARTVIDIGCGFGHTLDSMREVGFETWGVDPDPGRASYAAARGHAVLCGEITPGTFDGRRFDFAILNHVIEHVPDPVLILTRARELLIPGGFLFVACPNFAGLHAKITKAHYNQFCPPEHICYFTAASLRHAVGTAGFSEHALETHTHPVHVKQLLAFLCYLRFLRRAPYRKPGSDPPAERFVDRGRSPLRMPAYATLLAVSRFLAPAQNKLGGDHLESYWRRI